MSEREHRNTAMLAYHFWCSRGYPEGQADRQWLEAEETLEQYRLYQLVTSETSLFGLAAFVPSGEDRPAPAYPENSKWYKKNGVIFPLTSEN